MKTLFATILSSMLFSSCLYTQKAAIKKFCKSDTISTFVTLHDTIRIKEIQADTTFSDRVDSVVVERDRLVIRYIKKNGIVYLQGKCKGDTIYISKEVKVSIPVLTTKSKWYNKYWWLPWVIILILKLRYYVVKKIEKIS
jgi:hypothetical protein